MKRIMTRSALREVKGSFSRWIAILAIIALGVGFFCGLKVCREAFLKTGDTYLNGSSFFDYELVSTLGIDEENVSDIKALDGVADAEGSRSCDILISNDSDQGEKVAKLHTVSSRINTLKLISGRMPEAADECVVDSDRFGPDSIGSTVVLTDSNKSDTLDMFAVREFTIVGLVQSPLYLNFERGSTSLGDGSVSCYMYVTEDAWDIDYYTEMYVTLEKRGTIFSNEYENNAASMEDSITEAFEACATSRYEGILEDAYEELDKAQAKLDDAKQEVSDGEKELKDNKKKIADAESEIADGEKEIKDGERKLSDGRKEISDNEKKLSDAEEEIKSNEEKLTESENRIKASEKKLRDGEKEISENEKTLKDAKAKLENSQKELDSAVSELSAKEALLPDEDALAAMEAAGMDVTEFRAAALQIAQAKAQLQASQQEIDAGWAEYNSGLAELNNAKAELEAGKAELEAGKAEVENGRQELANAKAEVAKGRRELSNGKTELAENQKKLNQARNDLEKGKKDLAEGKKKLADGEKELAEARQKIADAEEELDDARDEVEDIENPDTYVLGRDTNIGYVCFENDTNIVDGIAKVFPAFFFLVAALVVMTTMTRMIDEQRTQIGVLKALGYSRRSILMKYVFYSGSAALLGGSIGFFAGSYLFPWVIWQAYTMMYGFSDLLFVIDPLLGSLSILVALICAVGTTLFCCFSELREVPAQLIRPKAPAIGKRILLERIGFIWSRMPFLHKVSARNIFRYKKRFFMMIMGICGCTALLITGLGISDSIKHVVSDQYDEIFKCDYTVTFDDGMTDDEMQEFIDENPDTVKSALFVYTVSMDAKTDEAAKSVNLIVLRDEDVRCRVNDFIDIHDTDGNPLKYPETGECIINSNLGVRLGLNVGDTITITDSDMNSITAVIAAECENFVYNYMYINRETYEQQMGDFNINSALVIGWDEDDLNAAEGAGFNDTEASEYADSNDTKASDNSGAQSLENDETAVSRAAGARITDTAAGGAALMNADNVAAVSITQSFRDRVDNMMSALDYVIALVVASAGALAFIVLYNLTNINITERIREIATIKVLGFNRSETAQYVFRENVVLTAISALVGIPLGKWLHGFVMDQVVIDLMCFDVHIEPLSYVMSVVITFVFALIVNFVMYFKLDKINMAESLKSIE